LDERNKIVRGEVVPEGGEGDVKGIPDFWVQVLASHDAFEELISEKDKQVLAHLQDVSVAREVSTGDDGRQRWTVKLSFQFEPNEFFEESELTKTYIYLDQEESIAEKAIGCDVTWKAGVFFPSTWTCVHT
jgi:nucleosome assembly protein 1-like 1